MRRCPNCGAEITSNVRRCASCSAAVFRPRRRSVAIVLAVIFATWTFLYTYRKDRTRFWIAICIGVAVSFSQDQRLISVAAIGLWAWAVIDRVLRSKEWFESYPN